MNKIILGVMAIIICPHAWALGLGGDCTPNTIHTFSISNGTMTMTECAYVMDKLTGKCDNIYCPCCRVSPYYTCNCNPGFYTTGKSQNETTCTCEKCPVENSTCTSSTNFSCNKGYYKDGSKCSQCPDGGTTSGSGATSKSACYIPKDTPYNDPTGNGTYTENCPY